MVPSPSPSESARRNLAIDGLRGVAALTVFAFHAWLYTRASVRAAGANSGLDSALGEMRIGLVLFFVLSGFLLFGPWVTARLQGTREAPRTATYFAHRIGRIVPAYYVAIIGSALLLWPLAGESGVRLPPLQQLPLFFVFAQNQSADSVMTLDPPMWTLAVEASFYAVLPLIGWAALRSPRTRLGQSIAPVALLIAGVVFNALLAQQDLPDITLSKSLPAMAPYFAAGMLAAVWINGRAPSRRTALLMLAGGAALVLGDAWVHAGLVPGSDMALRMRIVRDLPAAAGFAAIVALAATRPPRALAWRPLAFTGLVSYGLYLWHVPVLLVMRAGGLLPMSTFGAMLTALPVSILVGWLSFRLIERPAIAWSRRTRLFGANPERVSRPAPRSARTARGRTPSTAEASR
jgi:peptidoglycan/LPS O-acetylase OafA/YrhL